METTVTEIAPSIYRLSTFVDEANFATAYDERLWAEGARLHGPISPVAPPASP